MTQTRLHERSPLTEREIEELLLEFRSQFFHKYNAALASGAVSDSDLDRGSIAVAKCCLILAADSFRPLTSHWQRFLNNLRNFI